MGSDPSPPIWKIPRFFFFFNEPFPKSGINSHLRTVHSISSSGMRAVMGRRKVLPRKSKSFRSKPYEERDSGDEGEDISNEVSPLTG